MRRRNFIAMLVGAVVAAKVEVFGDFDAPNYHYDPQEYRGDFRWINIHKGSDNDSSVGAFNHTLLTP